MIVFGNERDPRLGFIEFGEQIGSWQYDFLVDCHATFFNRRTVRFEKQRRREIASGSLRADDFLELIAIGIENRFGATKVVRHRQKVAAYRLGMLADIGVGHDHRLLDHRARACRKKSIESAVERGAGDHRDQDGRNSRDHREETDDLNVKARPRPPAAAGLHDLPDLAADNAEQQQAGDDVAEQELDHDLVNRCDWG